MIIARARHIHDERLLDGYFGERRGESLDPRIADHLAECEECAARYARLACLMNDLRTAADAETAVHFPPARLQAQQHQIARRLEQVGRAARVISFPGQLIGRHLPSAPHVATCWIAGAAAAGLFVGVAVGMFSESHAFRGVPRLSVVGRQAPIARPAGLTPVATRGEGPAPDAADNAFLSDLEVALERPRTRELLPFDALTPHVREVSDRLR